MIKYKEDGIPSNLKDICDNVHLCAECKWSRNIDVKFDKSYYYICINGCHTTYNYVDGSILYPYCNDIRKSKTCHFYEKKE